MVLASPPATVRFLPLLFAACACSAPCNLESKPGPLPFEPDSQAYAGQELSRELRFEFFDGCTKHQPTGTTIDVTDPAGALVEFTHTGPTRIESLFYVDKDAWVETVTFVPPVAGRYRLVAKLEPDMQVVERFVDVFVDRRNASWVKLETTGPSCPHVERTAAGGLLCPRDAGVFLFRDGGTEGSCRDCVVQSSGDVVWIFGMPHDLVLHPDGGQINPVRSVIVASDPGAGKLVALAVANATTPRLLAATPSMAMALEQDRLHLWSFDAGTVSQTGDLAIGAGLQRGSEVLGIALSPDGRFGMLSDGSVWTRFFVATGTTAPQMRWFSGGVFGHEPDRGLWLALDSNTFSFERAEPDAVVPKFRGVHGWHFGISATSRAQPGERPLLFPLRPIPYYAGTYLAPDRTEVLVPVVGFNNEVLLHHYLAPPEAQFVEVTDGVLRAEREGGTQYLLPLQ